MTRRVVIIAVATFCLALGLAAPAVFAQEGETERIAISELKQKLDSGERLLLIDVREDYELERDGAIPGAIHIPFQRLADEQDRLRGYDVLIVYGDGFKDDLAGGMSKRLLELGFKDVRTLRGGLKAWTRGERRIRRHPKFDTQYRRRDPPPGADAPWVERLAARIGAERIFQHAVDRESHYLLAVFRRSDS